MSCRFALYHVVEWEEVGRWTVDWYKALQGTSEVAADIALSFVPGGRPLVDLVRQISKGTTGKDTPVVKDAFRKQVKQLRLEQLRSIEQFEFQFSHIMEEYVARHGKRLVVFVDDLDRCLPENAIEVLEALKLFLNVRGGLFILGLDSQAIEAAISARYRGELKATEFMDMTSEEEPPVPPGLRTLVTDETAAQGVLELFERDLYSTEASR